MSRYDNSYSPRRRRSPSYGRRRRRSRSRDRSYGRRRSNRHNPYDRRRSRRSRSYSRGRGYGRRNRYNNRNRSPSQDPLMAPLDRFRPRDLSLPRPTSDEGIEIKVELKEKEVAYVFGRMGTTKDKLARVSGTNIELQGSALVIQGHEHNVALGKRYVQILLNQRSGNIERSDVTIDPEKHITDLTLLDVPNNCKGFVTGRGGDTLRQIEHECATLMTFCKNEEDGKEPLAIFGSRRGRMTAQLKVMSIVEGKHIGWFVPDEDVHPNIYVSDNDKELGGGWDVSYMKLDDSTLGYALGKGGDTRHKLQTASGCIIQYIGCWAAFGGTADEQSRGKTYLQWLLNQRNHDFEVDIEGRTDLSTLWVPEPSVGYVTGVKAKTLRNLENKSGTFCFFDKRRSGRPKEKMLIFAHTQDNRDEAIKEIHSIVNFHQKKIGGRERATTYSRSYSGSRSRSSSRDNSRSKSRNSRSKSRSISRSRSRSRSRS